MLRESAARLILNASVCHAPIVLWIGGWPKEALILLAKRFAGIEAQEAEMTSVDRLGFHSGLPREGIPLCVLYAAC
jgi:hypothetical protein